MTTRANWFRRVLLAFAQLFLLWIASAGVVYADSVGQVQTTKYFAPETVAMLKQRVTDVANHVPGATMGFKAGDLVSYIIQFTPVGNGATIGAGGYITDYIPNGVIVTGAWFVQPDGLGGYYQTPPPAPAQMADGWGAGGTGTYAATWTTDAYTIATCTAAGKTLANCTGSLAQIYADTGIFYSTDSRTQAFLDPSTDGRVAQWSAPTGNGYNVCPTRGANLVTLMGGAVTTCAVGGASTHNFWDASMTSAFGTSAAFMTTLATLPRTSGNTAIVTSGAGPAPFNSGSAVAGPDSGYQLDYTGTVGPWQRISYPGSTIGSNAFVATKNPATIVGTPTVVANSTVAGSGFPLPSNTNAVRWAAGRLVVGTQSYVKITVQLTSTPPSSGLVNNSEVFGGDASPESANAGNRDSAWIYHVPSVASNVSTLYVLKEVECVYDATGTCVANNGANIPNTGTPATVGPKLRYRLTYINTNNGTQHNVVICDQLPSLALPTPAKAPIVFATQVTQISATPNIGVPTSTQPVTTAAGTAVAACGFAAGGTAFNYPTIPTLAGGGSGILEYDVQFPVLTASTATTGSSIVNTAKAVSTEIPAGVTSFVPSNVVGSISANLIISKTASPTAVAEGGTTSYTINVSNTGSTAASISTLVDTLPGVATAVVASQAASRFNYVSTSSVTINGAPLSGVVAADALPLTPATTNSEVVTWTFAAGTTIPAGGILSLTFNATAGGAAALNLMVNGTAYNNTAVINCSAACVVTPTAPNTTTSLSTGATAPVTMTIPNLTIAKSIDCVFVAGVCTPGSYVAGSSIPASAMLRYKIAYTNPMSSAQTITITDTLPASTTAAGNLYVASGPDMRPSTPVLSVNPAAAGAARGVDAALTTIAASSVVTFTAASVPGYGTGAIYIDVQTNAAAAAVVTNSASISSLERTAAAGAAIPAATVSATVSTLNISKAANVTTVVPGGNVIYTITVTNPTAAAVALTTIADTLPLAAPGTVLCATTAATCLATTVVMNNGVATAAPTLVQTAATGTVGQINTWTLPAATSLAAGTSLTLSFTATYSATVPRGTTYRNSATVNGTGGSTGLVAPVSVPYNTLTVSKAVLSPASASIAPNSPVTYTVTVTNTGTTAAPVTSIVDTLPSATTGIISYTSTTSVLVNGVAQTAVASPTLPVGAQFQSPAPAAAVAGTAQVVTWTFPAAGTTVINPGQTMVITFVATFGAVPTATTYTNDIKVVYTGGLSPNLVSTGLAPVTVASQSQITKTIDCIYNPTCVSGSYVDGTAIPVNALLGYKIVYGNLSTLAASGVAITDTLPAYVGANAISNLVVNGVSTVAPANTAGTPPSTSPPAVTLLTGGTLNPFNTAGATGTITFALQTNAVAGAGVTNTAKMVSTQDPTGVTSLATAQAAGGNLSVTKAVTSGTSSTIAQGGLVSYTISVSNTGSAAATLTTLVDTLPGVANAAGATFRFAYTATGASLLNGVATAAPTVVDVLPAAPATANSEVVTWTFGAGLSIPAGQTLTLTFTATVGTAMPNGVVATPNATYYNSVTANYTGGAFTSSVANNQAPVVVPFYTLTMVKTIDCVYNPTCIPGSYVAGTPIPVNAKIGYKLVYTNLSPVANTAVLVTDTLPTQTAANAISNMFVNGVATVAPTNTAAQATPVTLVTGGTLAAVGTAGSTGTITFDLQTNALSGVTVSNMASITSTQQATASTSTVAAVVLNMAQLAISKTTSTPTLTPGNRATYTVTITNNGAAATSALKVLDFLPFDGTLADMTRRLNYVATTGYTVGGVATALTPTITTSSPPLVSPYGSNPNQQQIQWDFGAYALAAGSTLTITFTADTGSNMTTGASYLNTVQTQFVSSGVSMVTTAQNLAPIKLLPHVTMTKSIIAVCSGVGCTPAAYVAGTVIPTNAKIRYQIAYSNPSTTDAQTNVVLSDVLPTQTLAAPVSNLVVVTGAITAPAAATLSGLAAGGATLTFPTLASLPASATGTITFDVQTNAAAAITVNNTAKVITNEDPIGVTSLATVNTTSLVLTKSIDCIYSGATCTSGSYVAGTVIPASAKVRYKIVYSNASTTTAQTNVVLSDVLPTQTGTASVSNVVVVTGAISAPTAATLSGLAAGGATLTFPTLASLPASGTGTITLDVQTNAAAATTISNTARLVSTEDSVGVSSTVTATITSLVINKTIIGVCSGGAACVPTPYTAGAAIPASAKLRYQIVYTNASTTTAEANVVLSDALPTQTAAAPVSNVVILSGLITAPTAGTLSGLAAGGATLTFPTLASLPASATGTITLDVLTNAGAGIIVSNTAKLVSTGDTTGVTSTASATVSLLTITKTTSTPSVVTAGTVTYTITVTNNGAVATTALKVDDFLPFSGTVLDPTKRFTYLATTGYTKNGSAFTPTTPVLSQPIPPAISPYSANPNQQQVIWDFGTVAANQLAPGNSLTITFTATVGSALTAGNYTNSALVEFTSSLGVASLGIDGAATVAVSVAPTINLGKVVSAYSDPVNGTTNAKFLPGGIAEYSVTASNAGGPADTGTVFITDSVPPNTSFYVKDLGAVGSGPVTFVQGTPTSGLTYTFTSLASLTDDVDFSIDNGTTWNAVPVADANGCATVPFINRIRINPKGIFTGNATVPNPNFTFRFRVCLQ